MKGEIYMMAGVGLFSIVFILLSTAPEEVSATIDPVATYSGMAVLCDGRLEPEYGFIGSLYSVPFPRPPGHPEEGEGPVLAKGGLVGISSVPDHYVSANVTRCEAWVAIVPKDDPNIPQYGTSLAGRSTHSGDNITIDLALGITSDKAAVDASNGIFGDVAFYEWNDSFVLSSKGQKYARIFVDAVSGTLDCQKFVMAAGRDNIVDGVPLPSGQSECGGPPNTCGVSIRNENRGGPQNNDFGTSAFDDLFSRDDCALVLWGVAVYYDVAVPAYGHGTIDSIDTVPVSVRKIVKGDSE